MDQVTRAMAEASSVRVPCTLKQSACRRLPRRRDDSGLITLEWLLIVAAVAVLAALAVVLVQNVVDDAAEQIAGSNARKTAATIAADQIMRDAQRDSEVQPVGAKQYEDWAEYYKRRCERLEITYENAGVETHANFDYGTGLKGESPVDAEAIDTYDASGQTDDGFDETTGLRDAAIPSGRAVAHCVVADK